MVLTVNTVGVPVWVMGRTLRCDKEESGTLRCEYRDHVHRGIEAVAVSSHVAEQAIHFGPQDEPHVVQEIAYGGECRRDENTFRCTANR